MNVSKAFAFLSFTFATALMSGCGGLLKDLRGNDFSNEMAAKEPTSGGMWPERGWLEDSEYEDRSEAMSRIEKKIGTKVKDSEEDATDELASAKAKAAPKARAKKDDFIDRSQNSGSLWASDGQTNYFFTKNRVKTVGDIISIQVEDQMVRDIASEVKRTLSRNEREFELSMANEPQEAAVPTSNEKAAEAVSEAVTKREITYTELDLSKQLGIKSGDTMMAEIIERYPNGNYKLRGNKRVSYRSNTRLVEFSGIAPGSEIDDGDKVPSGKFYEYKLDVERPGSRL